MKYYIEKTLNTDFETSISKTKEALQKEGFGVLSEIDIHEKLKEKLGVDFRKYKILGACNPPLAYEALQIDNNIGAMLPCNIVVQEIEPGKTEIAAIDPYASMMAVENEKLFALAERVKNKLNDVIKIIE